MFEAIQVHHENGDRIGTGTGRSDRSSQQLGKLGSVARPVS